jgi:hypothetical protein
MRHTCDFMIGDYPGERCDLPAVDSYTDKNGNTKFMCADHWDTRERLLAVFRDLTKKLALRKNL